MSWAEIIFWTIQGLFDLLMLAGFVFLFLAVGGLGQQHKFLRTALGVFAQTSDENFKMLGAHVSNMARFLIQQFNLDAKEPAAPKKITPPDWKN